MTGRRPGGPHVPRSTEASSGKPASSRRSFLAAVGAAGIGATVAGCTAPGGQSGGSAAAETEWPAGDTQWGDTVQVGDGEVSTFVSIGPNGDKAAGIEMTPGALAEDRTGHVKFVLGFPETDEVPFSWFGFDWEPGGHYPGDVYAIPHFDFHFYFTAHDLIADVPTVALPPEEHETLYTYPMPTDQHPPGYFRTNYVFGYMGEHLYDETAPEYNGETFGNTFVYGHWDGELIFMEPMITVPYFEQLMAGADPDLAQLEGVGHDDRRELSMPDRFPTAGEYPTEYAVRYREDRDVFTIVQDSFESFEASAGLPADADTSRSWEEEPPHVTVVHADEQRSTSGGGDGHTHTATESASSESADATVAVAPGGRLVFEPETLEVATGDTVAFDWKADYHNVAPVDQPDGASWQGEPEIRDAGHTHVHTFEVAGRYDYVCEPHESQGMVGAVVVEDA